MTNTFELPYGTGMPEGFYVSDRAVFQGMFHLTHYRGVGFSWTYWAGGKTAPVSVAAESMEAIKPLKKAVPEDYLIKALGG